MNANLSNDGYMLEILEQVVLPILAGFLILFALALIIAAVVILNELCKFVKAITKQFTKEIRQ